MDNLVGLLTSTTGRVSRKSWWIGAVALIAVYVVAIIVASSLAGVSAMPNFGAMVTDPSGVDPATVSQSLEDGSRWEAWIRLAIFAVLAFPCYALAVKRRHDRDNNGADVLICMGLVVVLTLLQAVGIGWEIAGGFPVPTTWLAVVGLLTFIFAIYLLVVMGFLKGTAGPNQYGPDPLGAAAPAAA